jgi:signal transduction histidine kinase
MTYRHSLRSRIIVAFCIFGAILGIVYATTVYLALDLIDDHLIDSRLKEEVDYLISHYQRYKDYPGPRSPYISAYAGTGKMPLYVLDMIEGLDEGLHEAYREEEEYHIAIVKIPDQQTLLYLLYEVSALEFTEKRKLSIRLVLIAGVVLIMALGLWIGWLTSLKVMAPVAHLSELVDKSGPDNLPTELSKTFFNDEVGVLAKALEQAMQRVQTFVQREHQFSRYASHELRTPVTIIKGAVVLLKRKLSGEDDPAYRPLKRIERSVTNMENIIESLLWLAREGLAVDQDQVLAVGSVVQETIEQNRYLIGNKPVEMAFVPEGDPQLSIPAPIFQIMLTNLIRNAIQHTTSGKIRVIVRDDRIIVSDTGAGMKPEVLMLVTQSPSGDDRDSGHGIGLSIVRRLCNRLNWNLEFTSEPGRGTTAQLIFS